MDQQMFNALQQSGAEFAAKQDMMENNYTSEMNIYNPYGF